MSDNELHAVEGVPAWATLMDEILTKLKSHPAPASAHAVLAFARLRDGVATAAPVAAGGAIGLCLYCLRPRIVATSDTTGCCDGERRRQGYVPAAPGAGDGATDGVVLHIGNSHYLVAVADGFEFGKPCKWRKYSAVDAAEVVRTLNVPHEQIAALTAQVAALTAERDAAQELTASQLQVTAAAVARQHELVAERDRCPAAPTAAGEVADPRTGKYEGDCPSCGLPLGSNRCAVCAIAASFMDEIGTLNTQVAKLTGERDEWERAACDYLDVQTERDRLAAEVERLKGELEAASLARVLAAGTAVADRNAAVANRALLVAERDFAVARADAMLATCKAACGASIPSSGHDYVDEVCGLLRVTRGQRDDAWKAEKEASAARDQARADLVEETALRERMSVILKATNTALKGEPPPFTLPGWADLPQVASTAISARDAAVARAEKAFQCHGDVPCGACVTCLNGKLDTTLSQLVGIRTLIDEQATVHRWNIREDGDALIVCKNGREKSEACAEIRYIPEALVHSIEQAQIASATQVALLEKLAQENAAEAEKAQAQASLLQADAERWRAFLSSARIRMIGSAGLAQDNDYAHLSMEIWTTYPGVHDNHIGIEWLSQYADKARRALAARQKGGAA